MNTRRLDEGTRLVGATSWAAIAYGVFLALALQTVLLLLGIAVGVSVGDRGVGNGYAVWAVIVQLVSIGVGAAVAGAVNRREDRASGMVAGVMTWAVVLVLGGILNIAVPRGVELNAWLAFFGAILTLGVAAAGGAFGASLARSTRGDVTRTPDFRAPEPSAMS